MIDGVSLLLDAIQVRLPPDGAVFFCTLDNHRGFLLAAVSHLAILADNATADNNDITSVVDNHLVRCAILLPERVATDLQLNTGRHCKKVAAGDTL